MLLNFFVARLKNNDPKSKATEVLLRFSATDDADDLTSNEPALASFCFPLGPESITPKEYMASEVGLYLTFLEQQCAATKEYGHSLCICSTENWTILTGIACCQRILSNLVSRFHKHFTFLSVKGIALRSRYSSDGGLPVSSDLS